MAQDSRSLGLASKNIAQDQINEIEEIYEDVTADLRLAVGEEEYDRTTRIAQKSARQQPGRLRMCSRDCGMRDACPFIVGQEESNWPDSNHKRCPIEVRILAEGFGNQIEYLESMIADGSEPTAYEIGLCRSIAWMLVEEHRMLISASQSPEPIIRAAVPGTEGEFTEHVNPRIDALTTIRKDIGKEMDRLTKSVERRLKNAKAQREIFVKSIGAIRKEMENDPEKYRGTRLGGLINVMEQRVEANELEMANEED